MNNQNIDDDLVKKIFALSKNINKKNRKLKTLLSEYFTCKVKLFIALDPFNDESNYYETIKSFYFSPNNNDWKCKYVHETLNHALNNYCIDSDLENKEMSPCYKKIKVSFGNINGIYYLDCENEFIKVYTSNRLPKLYSTEYEYAANVDQYDIMDQYSKNKNIAEWLAIRFFLQVYRHKYYVEKINKYFRIV